MTLNEKITQLVDGILNEEEKRFLEDFVDNYVGTNEENYISTKDFHEQNKQNIMIVMRKMKEAHVWSAFYSLIYPHINKGIYTLFTEDANI